MKVLNKTKLTQFTVILSSLLFAQYANANFGQKIASKLQEFSNQLTVVAGIAFVIGLILLGFSLFFGGGDRAKALGAGAVIGALIIFFAPDIANLFFS